MLIKRVKKERHIVETIYEYHFGKKDKSFEEKNVPTNTRLAPGLTGTHSKSKEFLPLEVSVT